MKQTVEYSHNNSGGSWWLKDEDWHALEKAGWKVDWKAEGRWLGALATGASREGLGMEAAVAEWESVTGACSTHAGCACCGKPHSFTYYEDDKYVSSGPNASYDCSW